MFMIKLRKTGGHFSAAGARRCHYNKRTFCLNVIILAVSFITDNERDISRITRYNIMKIDPDAKAFQAGFEKISAALSTVLCDDNAAHIKAGMHKFFPKPENIRIIGYAKISTDFVAFDISRAYDDHDFRLVCQLL